MLYSGEAGGLVYHLLPNGFLLQLVRQEEIEGRDLPSILRKEEECHTLEIYRVDVEFVRGRAARVSAQEELPGWENFYNVGAGASPALFVRKYRQVRYEDVWDGVDVVFRRGERGELEYDFEVARGVDVGVIRMRVRGAQIRLQNGRLLLETPLGVIEQGEPHAWAAGRRLRSGWKVEGDELQLWVEGRNLHEPLHIDPIVQREWGTYFGGVSHDEGGADAYVNKAVAVFGNFAYLAGATISLSQIATAGAHQTSFGGGPWDAFLAKFNISTVTQEWGTYYGGRAIDWGWSCAVDGLGGVYLAGTTNTDDNSFVICPNGNCIATPGSHQPVYGGFSEAFLAKFYDSNGQRDWGTYYGGGGWEEGLCCATDGTGVYLVGSTTTSSAQCANCIATPGSHQEDFGGSADAFLVKFNTNGQRLWGTYYGGGRGDYGSSCTLDGLGGLYLAGTTETSPSECPNNNPNCIATPGVHQPIYAGTGDAFLVKFDAQNGQQIWGTYYGGIDEEFGISCAVDGGGVYLAGITRTDDDTPIQCPIPDCIATPGAHQTRHGGDEDYDAFLVRFDPANGRRLWGTYYGGLGDDEGYACAVDNSEGVYLVGTTQAQCLSCIATPGSHQVSYGGGPKDAFLAKFCAVSGQRVWGTYYGGVGEDYPVGVVPLSSTYVLFGGATYTQAGPGPISTSTPPTLHQPNSAGVEDLFLALFQQQGNSNCTPLAFSSSQSDSCPPPSPQYFQLLNHPSTQPRLLLPAEAEAGYEWTLYDMLGRPLQSGRGNARELIISLHSYPAGRYCLVLLGQQLWRALLEKPAEE
ncbi:MAG: hypothetical protein RMJ66_06065 [Bacteroidia bacterium]|nr:hypothetical protein [Bacteroidia bacterium]MDW8134616.1 hypothetical protein [Bacteroidia bacterium]